MKFGKNTKILFLVFVVTAGLLAAGDLTGKVISASSICGNLVCEVGEGPAECPVDCVSICGDGICYGGETLTCKEDCTGAKVVELKEVTFRDGLLESLR